MEIIFQRGFSNLKQEKIIIKRGEIAVSELTILMTNISSCVSICMYNPEKKVGGITHISNSRNDDTTPSGRYIKKSGYHYTDEAIPGILSIFSEKYGITSPKKLHVIVAGGLTREGPIVEVLREIEKYHFTIAGMDIMRNLYRSVIFDPARGIITIKRKTPFSEIKPVRTFTLL